MAGSGRLRRTAYNTEQTIFQLIIAVAIETCNPAPILGSIPSSNVNF